MEIVYCIPCSYGQHDEHIEMIEVPARGVMGGARCPCKGECAERAPQPGGGEAESESRFPRSMTSDEVNLYAQLTDAQTELETVRWGMEREMQRADRAEHVLRAVADEIASHPERWTKPAPGMLWLVVHRAYDVLTDRDAASVARLKPAAQPNAERAPQGLPIGHPQHNPVHTSRVGITERAPQPEPRQRVHRSDCAWVTGGVPCDCGLGIGPLSQPEPRQDEQ